MAGGSIKIHPLCTALYLRRKKKKNKGNDRRLGGGIGNGKVLGFRISIGFPARVLGWKLTGWLVLRQYPSREKGKGREGWCGFDHGPIPAIMYSLITIFGRRGSALPIYRMERIHSSQRCFRFDKRSLLNIARIGGRREKRGFRFPRVIPLLPPFSSRLYFDE